MPSFFEEMQRTVAELMCELPAHHGIRHIDAVVMNIAMIAGAEPPEIYKQCSLAALLHDLGRTKPEDPRPHAQISAEMARELIEGSVVGFEDVVTAIAEHSKQEPASTLIGRYLQDADRMDGFGRRGLDRAIETNNLTVIRVNEILRLGNYQPEEKESLLKLFKQIRFQEQRWDTLSTDHARLYGLDNYAQLVGYSNLLYRILYPGGDTEVFDCGCD